MRTTTITDNSLLTILHASKAGISAQRLADKLRAPRPRVTARLRELKRAKRVHVIGKTKSTRWLSGPAPATKRPATPKKRAARAKG